MDARGQYPKHQEQCAARQESGDNGDKDEIPKPKVLCYPNPNAAIDTSISRFYSNSGSVLYSASVSNT
jgi:hypothetical protein